MKKLALLFVATVLVAGSFTSCKEDCPVDEPTKTELLTAGEWHGVMGTLYINDVEDGSQSIADWDVFFMSNFDVQSYIDNEPDGLYKWQFLEDETKIQFIYAYGRQSDDIWNIEELTTTDFAMSQTWIDGEDTKKIVFTYKH